jgi:hypothetical protein
MNKDREDSNEPLRFVHQLKTKERREEGGEREERRR